MMLALTASLLALGAAAPAASGGASLRVVAPARLPGRAVMVGAPERSLPGRSEAPPAWAEARHAFMLGRARLGPSNSRTELFLSAASRSGIPVLSPAAAFLVRFPLRVAWSPPTADDRERVPGRPANPIGRFAVTLRLRLDAGFHVVFPP